MTGDYNFGFVLPSWSGDVAVIMLVFAMLLLIYILIKEKGLNSYFNPIRHGISD